MALREVGEGAGLLTVSIGRADTASALLAARELFREYASSLGIDLSFQDFEGELETIDRFYETILIARAGDEPAGCVALRRIDEGTCEMKRLYVRPAFRGRDIGRRLAASIIGEARSRGFRRMLLDTLPSMQKAAALYESLGFRDVEPYRYNPIAGTRFMALELGKDEG